MREGSFGNSGPEVALRSALMAGMTSPLASSMHGSRVLFPLLQDCLPCMTACVPGRASHSFLKRFPLRIILRGLIVSQLMFLNSPLSHGPTHRVFLLSLIASSLAVRTNGFFLCGEKPPRISAFFSQTRIVRLAAEGTAAPTLNASTFARPSCPVLLQRFPRFPKTICFHNPCGDRKPSCLRYPLPHFHESPSL